MTKNLLDFLKRLLPDDVKVGIKNLIPKKKKMIIVVFRYDDYSSLSQTDLELKILEVCRKNEIAMTFAVVPFVIEGNVHDPSPKNVVQLSAEKAKILKDGIQDGVLDIALHGYSHQTNNIEHFSEFAGLAYTTQVDRLTKGKQLLENLLGTPIDIFVPPWNTYDLNTLRALNTLRFSTISGDRAGVADTDSKLKFLPCTCSLRRLKEGAIQSARCISEPNPIIVVLLHDFEFQDIDEKRGIITFDEFTDLVCWLKSQDDVCILSISHATKAIKDLTVNRFQTSSPRSALYRKQAP